MSECIYIDIYEERGNRNRNSEQLHTAIPIHTTIYILEGYGINNFLNGDLLANRSPIYIYMNIYSQRFF